MQTRYLLLMLMTIVTGSILPIQAGINSKLSKVAGGPVIAAFISFFTGTVILILYIILTRKHNFQWTGIKAAPIWFFTGGLIGAFYVSAITWVVPSLGAALTFALVITGQLIAAMIIDHYGWLGMAVKEISAGRIIGALLLVAGVILIRKY
ncbi:MAG: EamA-like transporter family protein [Bacteroidetes bacterium]|nr:MAG: EamA-like transporter family protein [Bacteroidota bacterium]